MDERYIDTLMRRVNEKVRDESVEAGQMTLGTFIAALATATPDQPCMFHLGGSPCDPASYRGFYEQLAFACGPHRTVADVLKDARSAPRRKFTGYKGGDYRMTRDTMIWSAGYGICGNRIVGAVQRDGFVEILTAPYED